METSDDPVIAPIKRIIDPFLGRNQDDDLVPAASVKQEQKTAAALPQTSEQKKLNKRRRASLVTRSFGPPTLGQPGLLGLN